MSACCGPSREPSATDRTNPERGRAEVALVDVPAGTFLMGGEDAEGFRADGEGPVREVTLSAFAIAPATVTTGEFSAFVDATGHLTDAERFGWSYVFHLQLSPDASRHVLEATVPGAPWWRAVEGATWRAPAGPGTAVDAELPVVHVSWHDAAAYAAWCGTRLPTEAEWERAARGGVEQRRFPWGDALDLGAMNTWQGDFPVRSAKPIGPRIASGEPNGFGLRDVVGNVWEWCADRWSTDWHVTPSAATRVDPQGRPEGTSHVVRGGSFLCDASYCNRYRLSARHLNTPDTSTSHTGFRVAASR